MVRAYLGIGGNLGYRHVNMRSAAKRARQAFDLVAASSLYETAPVGFQNQPPFLNAVLAIDAPVDPSELHRKILEIEADLGRRRTFLNAPRTIDIDILLFGDLTLNTDDLTIPHPRMHERAFVMAPLAEIAPEIEHPVLGKRIDELYAALGDTSDAVTPIDGPGWIDAVTPDTDNG